MKVKYVKLIQENYNLQVITDACVKTVVVEICFEKKNKQSVVETFIKCFAGFCQ